jgi:unsaturated rhamnogalacturonyl hydrolase
MKIYPCFFILAAVLASGINARAQDASLNAWPRGCSPQRIGGLVSRYFLDNGHTNFGSATPPRHITYPLPSNATPVMQSLHDRGLSWQSRFWIDDMFMVTLVQVQAYRATGDRRYIDRAAREMAAYLDTLQQPNGLFYHAPDVPFFWARGNGWVAAGMTGLLLSLPAGSPFRERIIRGYAKMMAVLKRYQTKDGLWNQLIDDPSAWPETSGSAMFAYALISGVKNGWLDEAAYGPVARKAWLGLVGYIDEEGRVGNVCEGTNKKNDRAYYLNRKRLTGDMHGEAPVLWCAYALLSKKND